MQSKITQASTIACLLFNFARAIEDTETGLGGPAPCIESYLGVLESSGAWDDIGGDPHAVHGLLAQDKSIVAVGGGMTKIDDDSGGRRGFIIRTNTADSGTTCYQSTSSDNYLDRFVSLTGPGTTC